MFNEFLDLPSPYLFHVYSNPHKFMNIFLSIWEILIGHTQSFLFFFVFVIVINMLLAASFIHMLLF